MPSPIAHAIASVGVHVVGARDDSERFDLRRFSLVFVAGVAADLDLLLGFTGIRHQDQTHGVGLALLAGVAAYGIARSRGWERAKTLAATAFSAWCVHIGLDFLNRDTHPPIGVMALWPFSNRHFKFPWALFLDIGRSPDWVTVRHDAIAIGWEILVLVPLLLVAWRFRRRARS